MKRGVLLFLVLVALAGCQQPATDPDQNLRDTIVGMVWGPDPAYSATDPVQASIYFYVGGRALIDQKDALWTYKGAVFTFTGPLGTYTTPAPAFDTKHFSFFYGPDTANPKLIHLSR